jgi:hypothetical protein
VEQLTEINVIVQTAEEAREILSHCQGHVKYNYMTGPNKVFMHLGVKEEDYLFLMLKYKETQIWKR